jgi:hypothetical protein
MRPTPEGAAVSPAARQDDRKRDEYLEHVERLAKNPSFLCILTKPGKLSLLSTLLDQNANSRQFPDAHHSNFAMPDAANPRRRSSLTSSSTR